MNYLELINKCLVELNYKQVGSFSELTKNDHKKLKNILKKKFKKMIRVLTVPIKISLGLSL